MNVHLLFQKIENSRKVYVNKPFILRTKVFISNDKNKKK